MKLISLAQELSNNKYPGRGIIIGRCPTGEHAIVAYFIMGRSENSRNRIFVVDGEGIRTQAFDPAKLTDPSLVIYAPVRVLSNATIVTNGDQTDTIFEVLSIGGSFERALEDREFEPDAPNFTPRISGLLEVEEEGFSYKLSILKSDRGNPDQCLRYTFAYEDPASGEGRFIHTYQEDGDPLPSFEGEPKAVEISKGIDEFTQEIWENLNEENKVSLFVRYIKIDTGEVQTRIINKNN